MAMKSHSITIKSIYQRVMWLTKINKPAKPSHLGMIHIYLQLWPFTVKGQSRSDSLLLSPYHWAKLFRGVVAIVAVPMRFAVIC